VEIALKQRLVIAGALVAALAAGWQIANGSMMFAAVLAGLLALWTAGRVSGVPGDALVGGMVLTGYLVGNRGFAQLHPPNLPLLPGELALGLGLVVAVWRAARTKSLPVKRDALNFVLLGWVAVGAARLRFDFPMFGFMSLRDFAMVYYAGFFFLALGWAVEPAARRWIERCLTAGFALVAPVASAFELWPDFFVAHTTVFDVPLIFVKSDAAGGFMVAGAAWFLIRYQRSARWWWLTLAAVNFAGVILGNSRGALAALAVVIGWIAICRVWRLLRPVAVMLAVSAVVLMVAAVISRRPWPQTTAYRLYESVASMTDLQGAKHYESPELGDKSDNNQFRLIWWRAVFAETLTKSPWLGLGFGYDLADQFMRVYYAEGSEEFAARSPHNFVLTVFARMGAVGLAPLLLMLGLMARQTWTVGRCAASGGENGGRFASWLAVWGIFTSACFGVVLEGPMGAVVFWTLLGVAAASSTDQEAEKPTIAEKAAGPALPSEVASV